MLLYIETSRFRLDLASPTHEKDGTRVTTGKITLEQPDSGFSDLHIVMWAHYPDGTLAHEELSVKRVSRLAYLSSMAVALLTAGCLVWAILYLMVFPDPLARNSLGPFVRSFSWVTSALGALAFLPLLASRAMGAPDGPFLRATRLPTRVGGGFWSFVIGCTVLMVVALYFVLRAKTTLVANETDRDAMFDQNGSIAFSFPKGLPLSDHVPRRLEPIPVGG